MTNPAVPSFPTSTSTSFDDMMRLKTGDRFVLRGFIYSAQDDARLSRANGIETVQIPAKRKNLALPFAGWERADVFETRAFITTLDELLGEGAC